MAISSDIKSPDSVLSQDGLESLLDVLVLVLRVAVLLTTLAISDAIVILNAFRVINLNIQCVKTVNLNTMTSHR